MQKLGHRHLLCSRHTRGHHGWSQVGSELNRDIWDPKSCGGSQIPDSVFCKHSLGCWVAERRIQGNPWGVVIVMSNDSQGDSEWSALSPAEVRASTEGLCLVN